MADEGVAVHLQVIEGAKEHGHVTASRGPQLLVSLAARHTGLGPGRQHHLETPGHRFGLRQPQLGRGQLLVVHPQPLHHRGLHGGGARRPQVIALGGVDDLVGARPALARDEHPRERLIEEVEQRRHRAPVVLEEVAHAPLLLDLLRQDLEHGHVRAAELVDGLLAISHRAQEGGLERERAHHVLLRAQGPGAALALLGQEQHQLELQPVGVLELVHEQRAQPLLRLAAEVGQIAEQVSRLDEHGGEVEHVEPGQLRVVALRHLREQRAERGLEGGGAPGGIGILQPPHRAVALAPHEPVQLLHRVAGLLLEQMHLAAIRAEGGLERGQALGLEAVLRHRGPGAPPGAPRAARSTRPWRPGSARCRTGAGPARRAARSPRGPRPGSRCAASSGRRPSSRSWP